MSLPTEGLDQRPQLAEPGALMTQALARLERSRVNLRQALTPTLPAQGTSPGWSSKLIDWARAWLRGTPWGAVAEPLVGAVHDTFSGWWTRQPWRQSALQARDTLSAELSPWVRRHPIAAIAVAAIAGGAVAASGVWRWRTVRRSAMHLAAQLRRSVAGQLGNPAVQSVLLGAVLSYLAARKQPPRTDPQHAPDAAGATGATVKNAP